MKSAILIEQLREGWLRQAARDAAEIAKLRGVLQDFYDWCGKDYPGWPAVEAALKGNP